MLDGFKEGNKKLSDKLSAPLAIAVISAVISAFLGGFVGSYLSYRAQNLADVESKATRVYNYLMVIREDLKRMQNIIDRDQFIDRVLVSKLLNWEGMKKGTQEEIKKEVFGRRIGKPFYIEMIGLAMKDPVFFNINTQLILSLDEVDATVGDIKNSLGYINSVSYQICSFDYPGLNPNIGTLRNSVAELDIQIEKVRTILTDCLSKIEGEIKRFSRGALIR